MVISERQLTLEEFLELPERKPALEYEDGRITQKVSPKGRHSILQLAGGKIFDRFGEPLKLARAFTELRTTYAGYSRVPDIAVYRWERIPVSDTGEVADEFFELPDIAVEIVSPKQSVNGLIRRCLWYVEHGVQAGSWSIRPTSPFRSSGPARTWLSCAGHSAWISTLSCPASSLRRRSYSTRCRCASPEPGRSGPFMRRPAMGF